MIRIRSLAISIATVLATVVACSTSGLAQSLPTLSRDDAWQSRRPTDQEVPLHGNTWAPAGSDASSAVDASEMANPTIGAAWQPSESANAVPHPRPVVVTPNTPTKQTRWIAPNSGAPQNTSNSVRPAAAKLANPQSTASQASSGGDRPMAREPQQFVPPSNVARLSEATQRDSNDYVAQGSGSTSAAASSARVPTNQPGRMSPGHRVAQADMASAPADSQPPKPKATASAAQTNDSAARYNGSAAMPRSQSERDQLTAAPAPPNLQANANRSQSAASSNRSANDSGWIHPLRQVAYESGMSMSPNPGEMELPDPNMSGGQWIGGNPGGPGDGSCGPSCPCEGAYSFDSGCCPCNGGPGCCDGCDPSCDPGCADEPSCGCSKNDDLICIGWGDDESCRTIRVRVPRFQEVMIETGVHGFKGPMDRDLFGGQSRDSGNFGFQEGINIGAKVPFLDWGYQLGYAATQSELSGDANTGADHSFTQSFVTGGVFHRSPNGLQGGVAWDWLHDERNDGVDLAQIRTELSLVTCGCHECGAMASFHMNDEKFTITDSEAPTIHNKLQATNQYLLFYRMHGCRGGEGRVFGGVDDDSDGIVGADFLLPMCGCWSLQSEFTYLIPDDSAGVVGSQQEAWNLAINLVWHWKGHARECHSNPYRPLFNVADNGSFIVDDRP